jgi:hypothetical protein
LYPTKELKRLAKASSTTKKPNSPPPPVPKRRAIDAFAPSAPLLASPPDLVQNGKLFSTLRVQKELAKGFSLNDVTQF